MDEKTRNRLLAIANYAERQYGNIRYQIDEKDGDLRPWIHGDDWPCFPLLKIAQEIRKLLTTST